jgi:hypothetical protein
MFIPDLLLPNGFDGCGKGCGIVDKKLPDLT